MAARGKKRPVPKGVATGRLEKGHVRLLQRVSWHDGQQVVVIPFPAVDGRTAPPLDMLEDDAAELARRPETLEPINRSELE